MNLTHTMEFVLIIIIVLRIMILCGNISTKIIILSQEMKYPTYICGGVTGHGGFLCLPVLIRCTSLLS